MSIASSDTLLSCPDGDYYPPTIPYELAEVILGKAIGRHIHQYIEYILSPVQFKAPDRELFREFWTPIADLMIVSSTFRAVTTWLICDAFGLRPSEEQSLPQQVYGKLRSLLLFGSAISSGAIMIPPSTWGSALMEGYGHYFIAQKQSAQGIAPKGYVIFRPIELRSHDLTTELSEGLLAAVEKGF